MKGGILCIFLKWQNIANSDLMKGGTLCIFLKMQNIANSDLMKGEILCMFLKGNMLLTLCQWRGGSLCIFLKWQKGNYVHFLKIKVLMWKLQIVPGAKTAPLPNTEKHLLCIRQLCAFFENLSFAVKFAHWTRSRKVHPFQTQKNTYHA